MLRMWLLLVVGSAASLTWAADSARDRLEIFSRGLEGLSGDFVQQTVSASGEVQEESHGTLALRAPRQFRWQYADPFPQWIIADGDNVWVYDLDLEQVTVRNQSAEEAQSPLTVLIDRSQLDRDFVVTAAPASAGLEWLELVAKAKEPAFKQVLIGLDGNGPQRMRLVDLLGTRTEWQFSHWQRTPVQAASLFQFTPPPGVDVVGDPVAHAATFPIKN